MFKIEIIADSSGAWCGNGMAYETIDSAVTAANDLAMRWVLVRSWRIVDCDTSDIVDEKHYRSYDGSQI